MKKSSLAYILAPLYRCIICLTKEDFIIKGDLFILNFHGENQEDLLNQLFDY